MWSNPSYHHWNLKPTHEKWHRVRRCRKLPCEHVHVFGLMKHMLGLPTHQGSMFLLTLWPVLCYGVTLPLRKPHVPTSSRHRVAVLQKGEMISPRGKSLVRKLWKYLREIRNLVCLSQVEIPLKKRKSSSCNIWELMITYILYGIESKTCAQDTIIIAYSSISKENQSLKDKD